MNKDQTIALLTGLSKVIGTVLTAHGATSAAAIVTASDTVETLAGLVMLIYSFWYAHKYNAPDNPAPPTSGTGSTKLPLLLLCVGLTSGVLGLGSGCAHGPQAVAYKTAATTGVTVKEAVRAYNVFAAQGKTTVAQNDAVKAAYQKYQAAFAVLCDAGAVYAATASTNAPAAQAALEQASVNASQTITDLINLVSSFGVKL